MTEKDEKFIIETTERYTRAVKLTRHIQANAMAMQESLYEGHL